jgi:hypothetical protein
VKNPGRMILFFASLRKSVIWIGRANLVRVDKGWTSSRILSNLVRNFLKAL